MYLGYLQVVGLEPLGRAGQHTAVLRLRCPCSNSTIQLQMEKAGVLLSAARCGCCWPSGCCSVTVSAKMQKVVQLLCVSLLLGRWLFPVTVAAAAATVQLGVVVSSSRDRQFTSMWAGLQAASGCRPIAMLASKSAVQEFG